MHDATVAPQCGDGGNACGSGVAAQQNVRESHVLQPDHLTRAARSGYLHLEVALDAEAEAVLSQ